MTQPFADKSVLVTGAGSGIGAATAILLAGRGAAVTLVGRRQAKLEEVAGEIRRAGGRPLVHEGDVSDPEDVRHAVEHTVEVFGGLDLAVNNAGIAGAAGTRLADIGIEAFRRSVAIEGWNVVATVRKESDLAVHGDLPGVRTLLLNVDDEQADLAFADLAAEQFGRVDALVNNAGYYQAGPLEGTAMDQVHRQFQTNVFGLIALNKAFIPHFRAQGSGVIVNIGSISADQGYPYTSVYEASKAAVVSLSEGLNAELAEFGVAVKAVLPGSMDTRSFHKIDQAQDVPDAYDASIKAFFSLDLFRVRSHPRLTADVIYEAVTDNKPGKVRYYSGPDGTAIPRAKQLLGQEWYWQEFRATVSGNPSALAGARPHPRCRRRVRATPAVTGQAGLPTKPGP